MGKTQSKRSVDITTENKKTTEDEITGKLEKIEDVDQRKQGNGEASQESNELEKKIDTEEPENDKDLTTEKSAEAQENAENVEAAIDTAKDTPPEGNVNEEISPLSDDSAKKSKKEKVKKKWSFRSISFGKKDKQKPSKSEETTEEIVANGEAEKSEAAAEQKHEPLKDSGAAGDTKQDTKIVASDKDINDEEKSTPTKKSPEVDVGISAAACATVEEVSEPANITDSATEKQTDENEIPFTVEAIEVIASNVLNTEDKKIETTSTEIITATPNDNIASSELIKEVISKEINENGGCDGEKPQENGTIEEQQTNILIEVNTDKASEDPIRSDPTVPNVNEENENVVAVDNDNNQNEIKNQVNLSDSSVKSIVQNDSLPPPLPCSPPPSQVSVFAFSNNTESDVSTSKVVLNSMEMAIVESPPNAESNLITIKERENKNDNDNNTGETTATIIISNELENKDKTVLSQEDFDSASTLQKLNCINIDSSANLVDTDCTNEKKVNADEQLEKEEIIAATVVKEITETAVVLCQQQLKENENENYSNKENNEDKDCVMDPPSTDSIFTNDTKETLIEICKDLNIETNTSSEQEDCLLEKIVQLKLSDDELRNDSEISKDLSKTDNAPEVTTQELTVSCE